MSLDVRLGPESIRPAVEGALSRRGLGLAWEDKPGALYSLVLVDIARGRQELRLYTSRPEVDLSRLEMLGLPRLGQGDHVLDLTTTFGADVDALTQPDSERRARRFDPLNPGAMTYQRFQFMVTP